MHHLQSILSLFLTLSFVMSGSAVFAHVEDEPRMDASAHISDDHDELAQHDEPAQQRLDADRMEVKRADMEQQREEMQAAVTERLDADRDRMEVKRADMEQKREETHAAVAGRHEEARARFEERKQEALRRHDEMKEKIMERREELHARWEEKKAELSERKKEIIKKHIERIINRTQSAIDRLSRLAEKITERVNSLDEDEADVGELRSLLSDAESAITASQTALDTAAGDLRSAPETDNPAEAIGNARLKFEEVKVTLREAHAALVEVITAIKKGQLISTDEESQTDEQ